MMSSSYAEQLAEAQRELALRKHVYRKKVQAGWPQESADRHLRLQEDIVETLQRLADIEAGQMEMFAGAGDGRQP